MIAIGRSLRFAGQPKGLSLRVSRMHATLLFVSWRFILLDRCLGIDFWNICLPQQAIHRRQVRLLEFVPAPHYVIAIMVDGATGLQLRRRRFRIDVPDLLIQARSLSVQPAQGNFRRRRREESARRSYQGIEFFLKLRS